MGDSQMADRIEGFGTTIFAEMSALAVRTGAINLGQGFPDTDGPAEVAEAAIAAIRNGHNQYPPGPGVEPLRRAISEHQHRFYGLDLDPDRQVLVTTGATEAIAAVMLALVDPGDEVVMFEPYYDSYAATVAMAHGVRKVVPLVAPSGGGTVGGTVGAADGDTSGAGDRWEFDRDRFLDATAGERCRLILLNTPHNPTGKVFAREELEFIAEVAIARDLLVVTDEVYEHLVYEGEHIPISSLPEMAGRTLSISSGGKTFSFTGWKIGWVTGPAELVAAVRTAKQFITYVSGGPLQYGIAAGLGLGNDYFTRLQRALREQRDLLTAGLTAAGLAPFRAEGGYFLTTDVAAIGETDGHVFCLELPARAGVVAIPSSVFYDDPDAGRTLVRWAFCKRPDVLAEATLALGRLG